MNRFVSGVVSLALVLSLALSACAAQQKPAPLTPAPSPEKPATGGTTAPSATTSEQQLIEGAKKEGEVVLWTMSLAQADKVFKPFTDKYPFLKVSSWDAPNDVDLIIRMIEEAKAGRNTADIVILGEGTMVSVVQEGLVKEYDWPNVKGWSNQPSHNFYRNLGLSLRAPMYNTDLVLGADIPRSWDALKDTKWRGKAYISASGDDTPLMFAYYWREGDKLNWDKAFSFWQEVIDKAKPRVVRGFTAPSQLLAAGEASLFLSNSMGAGTRTIKIGAPIDIAPVEFALGTPFCLSIVKKASHPNAAQLLANWLTSDEGLGIYANLQELSALNPTVSSKQLVTQLVTRKGIKIVPVPPAVVTVENSQKSSSWWLTKLEIK